MAGEAGEVRLEDGVRGLPLVRRLAASPGIRGGKAALRVTVRAGRKARHQIRRQRPATIFGPSWDFFGPEGRTDWTFRPRHSLSLNWPAPKVGAGPIY